MDYPRRADENDLADFPVPDSLRDLTSLGFPGLATTSAHEIPDSSASFRVPPAANIVKDEGPGISTLRDNAMISHGNVTVSHDEILLSALPGGSTDPVVDKSVQAWRERSGLAENANVSAAFDLSNVVGLATSSDDVIIRGMQLPRESFSSPMVQFPRPLDLEEAAARAMIAGSGLVPGSDAASGGGSGTDSGEGGAMASLSVNIFDVQQQLRLEMEILLAQQQQQQAQQQQKEQEQQQQQQQQQLQHLLQQRQQQQQQVAPEQQEHAQRQWQERQEHLVLQQRRQQQQQQDVTVVAKQMLEQVQQQELLRLLEELQQQQRLQKHQQAQQHQQTQQTQQIQQGRQVQQQDESQLLQQQMLHYQVNIQVQQRLLQEKQEEEALLHAQQRLLQKQQLLQRLAREQLQQQQRQQQQQVLSQQEQVARTIVAQDLASGIFSTPLSACDRASLAWRQAREEIQLQLRSQPMQGNQQGNTLVSRGGALSMSVPEGRSPCISTQEGAPQGVMTQGNELSGLFTRAGEGAGSAGRTSSGLDVHAAPTGDVTVPAPVASFAAPQTMAALQDSQQWRAGEVGQVGQMGDAGMGRGVGFGMSCGMGGGGDWELLQQLLGQPSLASGIAADPLQASELNFAGSAAADSASAVAASATAAAVGAADGSTRVCEIAGSSSAAGMLASGRAGMGGKRLRDFSQAPADTAAAAAAAAAELIISTITPASAARPSAAYRASKTGSGSPASTGSPATSASAFSSPSHTTSGSGGSSGQAGGELSGGGLSGGSSGQAGGEAFGGGSPGGVISGGGVSGAVLSGGGVSGQGQSGGGGTGLSGWQQSCGMQGQHLEDTHMQEQKAQMHTPPVASTSHPPHNQPQTNAGSSSHAPFKAPSSKPPSSSTAGAGSSSTKRRHRAKKPTSLQSQSASRSSHAASQSPSHAHSSPKPLSSAFTSTTPLSSSSPTQRSPRPPSSALASRLAAVLIEIQSKPAPPPASSGTPKGVRATVAALPTAAAVATVPGSAAAATHPASATLPDGNEPSILLRQTSPSVGQASAQEETGDGSAGKEVMVVGGRVGGTGGTGGSGSSGFTVARELLQAMGAKQMLPGVTTGLEDLESVLRPVSRRRTSAPFGFGPVSLNECDISGSGFGGQNGLSDVLVRGTGETATRGGSAAAAALSSAWWQARGQIGALEIPNLSPGSGPALPKPTAGPMSAEVTGPAVSGKFRSVEKFARAQLIAMAEAAEAGDTGRFHSAFVQLKPLGKQRGIAVERLTHYAVEGLMHRMAGTGFKHFTTPLRRPPKELEEAHALYASSQPFPLFGSASLAGLISEAVTGSTHVHIVDFGCFQPIHLPILMELLAARPGGPPSLRVTGMDTASFICAGRKDYKRLRAMDDVGRRLKGVARHLGVPFEFERVDVDEKNLELLYQVKRQWHETLVVVCFLELLCLPDFPHGPRDCMLRWVHDMQPTLFTFCDVDLDTNHSPFLPRFRNIIDNHLAIFNFHDVHLGNADKRLLSVFEEIYFARSIINGIACEGDERVVRSETGEQWRERLLSLCFSPCVIPSSVTDHVHKMLKRFPLGLGLQIEDGAIRLMWRGTHTLTTFAWMPCARN